MRLKDPSRALSREEGKMTITDARSLVEFIETTELVCAHKLIVLFAALKLKDEAGCFDAKSLTKIFLSFYIIRDKHQLRVETECNPFGREDIKEVSQLINKRAISSLMMDGILKTFNCFKDSIFHIAFENEEEILAAIKRRMGQFCRDHRGDSETSFTAMLSDWERSVNKTIKTNASKQLAGCVERVSLEALLKSLYHTFSLRAMNTLVADFQLTEREFTNSFQSERDYASQLTFAEREEPEEEPVAAEAAVLTKQKKRALLSFYQEMMETDVEEDYIIEQPKSKKKKKKKTKDSEGGFFKRLKKKFKK